MLKDLFKHGGRAFFLISTLLNILDFFREKRESRLEKKYHTMSIVFFVVGVILTGGLALILLKEFKNSHKAKAE